MSDVFIPIHQFEIRYTPILDFDMGSKKIVSPFIKLVNSFQIEQENTHRQRISLKFNEDFDTIGVWWDRIFIKTIATDGNFTESPSSFTSLFQPIFEKLKELDSFGNIHTIIFHTIAVKPYVGEIKDIINDFKSEYFTDKIDDFCKDAQDYGVVIESQKNEKHITCNLGPYVGVEDLIKRNIGTLTDDKYNQRGRMITVTITATKEDITHKYYKELNELANSYIEKL